MAKKKKLLKVAIKAVTDAHSALAEMELIEHHGRTKEEVEAIRGANGALALAMTDLFYLEKEYDNKSK
jgi:hypothetical protein